MFYAAKNLGQKEVYPCPAPWEFKLEKEVPLQIRKDKESRQNWYQNTETLHNFYTGFEGINPALRVNRESNPPFCDRLTIADYDITLSDERVDEAIKAMPIKPNFVERSLSKTHVRLIWEHGTIYHGGNYDYAVLVRKNLRDFLKLDLLPALDVPAFEAPSRLYANGCDWRVISRTPIPEAKLQAFLVKCGRKFLFKAGDSAQVPIAEVEKAMRAKFPSFEWPSDFTEGSQGPTFWVPESTSPQSAIVKEGGMFTFSAHADKPFYTWADLLGKEFVVDFLEASIASATAGIYWDEKNHWRQTTGGLWVSENDKGMDLHMTVTARLSEKPDSTGTSPKNQALEHIRKFQRVQGVGPFVPYPPGILIMDGHRYINTYARKAIQPSDKTEFWGTNFPNLARQYDWMFDPNGPEQLEHFLCAWKMIYSSALFLKPTALQNIIMRGGPGCGKTLTGRHQVGYSVGGAVDVSRLLVENDAFNASYFDYMVWSLDDDTPTDGTHAVRAIHAKIKKYAANDDFIINQKYMKPVKTKWGGIIFITTNLDLASGRIVQFDDSSKDKFNLYSIRADKGDFKFPDRQDNLAIRDREIPHLCQYLLDMKIPDKHKDPERWGIFSYQDKALANLSRQGSPAATFKELLIGALHTYFVEHSKEERWTGPVVKIQSLLLANPAFQEILRSIKIDQTGRHLEVLLNDKMLPMHVDTGDKNIRLYTFFKKDVMPQEKQETSLSEDMPTGNFQAPTQDDVVTPQ